MAPKMPEVAHLSLFLHDVCCKDYPKTQYRSSTPRLIDGSTENLYQRSLGTPETAPACVLPVPVAILYQRSRKTLETAPRFSDEGDLMCN